MKKIIIAAAISSIILLSACDANFDKDDGLKNESYSGASVEADLERTADEAAGFDMAGEARGDIENPAQQNSSEITPEAGLLTAAEWNDNKNHSFFLDLLKDDDIFKESLSRWGFNPSERYSVKVENNGTPVANASVKLQGSNGEDIYFAVTDNTGTAYLFRNLTSTQNADAASIAVKSGDETANIQINNNDDKKEYTIELNAENPKKSLDLMLVFDTTGSMSDELSYIQKEFEDIIKTVKSGNGNIPMRVSVNFYRDEGDAYVIRPYDFTEDFSTAIKTLNDQKADGGGDTPEAVHTALDDAVNNHEWNEDSVKLLFIVLDAPPHNKSEVVDSLQKTILAASSKGIRIIPVVASGSDKQNEFLMRTFAMATGGTYSFITDDSGIGDSHEEPTVGAYAVEKLNSLIIRIINSYLE